jgi:hypothetical protein
MLKPRTPSHLGLGGQQAERLMGRQEEVATEVGAGLCRE